MGDIADDQDGPTYNNNEKMKIISESAEGDDFICIDYRTMNFEEMKRAIFPKGYISELKRLFKIGVPMIFATLSQILIQPVAIIFGGHLGTFALSTIGLANSIISVLCITMFIGLTCACDTLYSQVSGTNNFAYLSILVQRTIVALSLVTLIMYGVNFILPIFLIAVGQDPVVSVLVGKYLIWFMPSIPCLFITKMMRNYTVVYGETRSYFTSGFGAVLLSVLCNYLFIYVFNWGLIGSAAAQNVANLVSTFLYILYVRTFDWHKANWQDWSWRLFERWGEFFHLAISGVFMISLEFWAFEISVFLAGLLGRVELGAQSIVFNLDVILYCFPAGLGITCSILCGQALGAGKPADARAACYAAISCCFVGSLVSTVFFATLRYELPKLFTSDPRVIELSAELLPFVAFYNLFMNISIVMRGVLRGVGKQKVGSVIISCSYYLMALPLGTCLMFLTDLKIKGMWLALCIALAFNATFYMIYIIKIIDWKELSVQAIERSKPEEKKTEISEKTVLKNGSVNDFYVSESLMEIDSTSTSIEDWLNAPMPQSLKIKAFFYISTPIIFFILCILLKTYSSMDEQAILAPLNKNGGLLSVAMTTMEPLNFNSSLTV